VEGRSDGDSVGARVTIIATGVPPVWGACVRSVGRDIAHALMSINAVKAVEIGRALPPRSIKAASTGMS